VLDAAAGLDERARGGSSPRRDQIEALLAEGLSLTAIAGRLGLTPQTVAYHAGRIRRGDRVLRRGATIDRHAIMTTLGCAGLRAHELCDLNVDDVDLVHDRLSIRDAKTTAGVRYVYLTPKLKGVLARCLAERGGAPGVPLFPTETGRRRTPDSLRSRVFDPVVDHARELRASRGHPVLPQTITPHTMRWTFISLWLETDPPAPIPWLMAEVGHAKPDTLLRIYAQVMQRDRAKIGSAFDALMAGAALPADPGFGPMHGPMGPNTASAASDDAAETP
jgi:integrase